jgi:recombinational DNA repair protein (RecF pathway)
MFSAQKLHGVLPDLSGCATCGEPFSATGQRFASGAQGVICKRCPKPEGAAALTAADLALLSALDKNPPHALSLPPDRARPSGAVEALLKGTIESFAERSFRSYRHLRAATAAKG